MKRTFSWEKFNAVPIVGILRHYSREQVDRVARQYEESGLSTLEITMNSPGAAATIAGLVKQFGGSLNIGAGTVCTEKDLDKAQAAGAQFIVTPILDKALIKGCRKKKIPIITGAYTPTEIYTAWSLGSSMVKVFPATQLGPAYIKEVLAPLDRLRLLPTGGVNPGNFIDFMRAGAAGAGMGGHLFPRELIDGGRWEELRGHFSAVLKIYLDYRQSLLSANQKPG